MERYVLCQAACARCSFCWPAVVSIVPLIGTTITVIAQVCLASALVARLSFSRESDVYSRDQTAAAQALNADTAAVGAAAPRGRRVQGRTAADRSR